MNYNSRDSSFDCSHQSVQNWNKWQFKLHLDQMKINKHYDCFPDYTYNTAFGSLLTGFNHVDQTVGIDNNSPIINDKHALEEQQRQQSIIVIIEKLINFLDEFLLYLSSIISCEQFQSHFQLKKMKDTAECIYQIRSILLTELDHMNMNMTATSTFDISSISSILRELASLIHCLSKEQQQQRTENFIDSSQNIMFSQLLDRLERTIQSCMDCVNSQSVQQNIPTAPPCINSLHTTDNSKLLDACLSPNKGYNIPVPWSVLSQIKNFEGNEHAFGLVYGIKDQNIRRKLGYSISKHKTASRSKRLFRKKSKQQQQPYKKSTIHTDVNNKLQQPLLVPTKQKIDVIGSKTSKTKDKKQSTNSIFFHDQDRVNRSGQTSPLIEDSPVSKSSDDSVIHRTSSHLNTYKNDSKTALSSPLSLQTNVHGTPSKTSITMSRENSQSLSPISNKSISSHRSRKTALSKKNSAINETRSITSIAQKYDEQNLNQINADYIDSSLTSSSDRTILRNDNLLNKSWSQRLTSPEIIQNNPVESNITSPIPSRQPSINDSINDFYSYNYSEHQKSPSASIHNEINDNISPLKVIEGPQSAEGEKKPVNNFDNDKNFTSTPYFNSINTQRQQSTSATKHDNLYDQTVANSSPQSYKQGYLEKFMKCFRRTTTNRVNLSKY